MVNEPIKQGKQTISKVVINRDIKQIKEETNITEEQPNAIIDTTLLQGAYGIDDLGNAVFAIDENTFYYPDSNTKYNYILRGDTLQLFGEDADMETLIIKELTNVHLILYNTNYQTIDTLIRRGPDTGKEIAEHDEIKEQFDLFLAKFSSDTLYQLRHVQFPLEIKNIDIEDNTELVLVSSEQWKHLDLRYDENMANREVDTYEQVLEVSSDSCIVIFKGIDNGIWIDHVFERKNNEWILVRLIDTSY
ncbi:DUF4348 domain-containing protein [Carboxylicivirga sp. A043]|uniref:DUF4348 domain-containing protein n=1 Tax=Carboxylicivirga litoralis TaxID=2816963 RepID=UPI0021CB882A|nr:DUF4348 domain-containing protein [Carboxylicivirga sp. A043]MCU4158365.1 DUF4348 domain-containing protein [Carboxylicivirga sp. A043]